MDVAVVQVKYVNGEYVASNPKPFEISGVSGELCTREVILKYECSEEIWLPTVKQPAVRVVTDNALSKATDDFQIVMQTVCHDKTVEIRVQHDIQFVRPEGHRDAFLDYTVRYELTEKPPIIDPGKLVEVYPPTRPVVYLPVSGQVEFTVLMGDNYAGFDSRLLSVREFVPADGSDTSEPLIDWHPLPGNAGVEIKANVKEETSYSLKLQPGDDSGSGHDIYLWVTTRPRIVSST